MTITVFGATGKMQHLLIQQALDAGHRVIAYARNPSKMRIQHERLQLVQGTLDDPTAIENAIAGSDAVVETVGAVSQGTRHIIAGMKKQGVKRLIVVSTANLPDENDRPGVKFKAFLVFSRMLLRLVGIFDPQVRHAVRELRRAGAEVRQSGLDWTLVRVLVLNDKGPAPIKTGYMGDGRVGLSISRTDMATFLLDRATDQTYRHEAPIISN